MRVTDFVKNSAITALLSSGEKPGRVVSGKTTGAFDDAKPDPGGRCAALTTGFGAAEGTIAMPSNADKVGNRLAISLLNPKISYMQLVCIRYIRRELLKIPAGYCILPHWVSI